MRRPSRSICARPTRSRKPHRICRADDAMLLVRPVLAGTTAGPADAGARRRGDRSAACGVVPARLERRTKSRACCSTATWWRIAPPSGARLRGFIMSRMAADEAEILSVAVARPSRAAALRARCCVTISDAWRRSACARCFWKSTKETFRRCGFIAAPAFARSDAARAIIRMPRRQAASTALVLRRDLV